VKVKAKETTFTRIMTNNAETMATASEKQLAANQANAKKSTGPKTAAGKAIVALNGVQHGIQAVNPVLPGESPHVWRRFKMAMYVSLGPVGMVEIVLAERITLTAWRQRRVTRFETESMRQSMEDADGKLAQRFEKELNENGNDSPGDLLDRAQQVVHDAANLQASLVKFVAGAATDPLTNEEAGGILHIALDISGRKRWPEDAWPPGRADFKGWTVALVRGAFASLSRGRRFRDVDQFICAVAARVSTKVREAGERPKEFARKRLKNRRINQMPDTDTCELIMRYEGHLTRQYHRDLHELERLQAKRLGQSVRHAISIDADVSRESKSD
jgi:hypothetical protein